MSKKGLLVVSFGTSYSETREKTIGAIERNLAKEFDDYKLYRAFTSKIIKRNLEKEGLCIFDVKEAMEQMLEDGVQEVLVQSTHIINGVEFDMMCDDLAPFRGKFNSIKVGKPLLTGYEDYKELAQIIHDVFPVEKDEALVLMGHGSDHHANSAYPAFEYVLKALAYNHILVGTVEGYPELKEVKRQLERDHIKKICLAPMMIVAGDHANNDMIGTDDSWKAEFEEEGYEVRYYLQGLGEFEGVQKMFLCHAKNGEEF